MAYPSIAKGEEGNLIISYELQDEIDILASGR